MILCVLYGLGTPLFPNITVAAMSSWSSVYYMDWVHHCKQTSQLQVCHHDLTCIIWIGHTIASKHRSCSYVIMIECVLFGLGTPLVPNISVAAMSSWYNVYYMDCLNHCFQTSQLQLCQHVVVLCVYYGLGPPLFPISQLQLFHHDLMCII